MSTSQLNPIVENMIIETTKNVFQAYDHLVANNERYTITEKEFIINMMPILGGLVKIEPEWVDGFMAYWSTKVKHNIHVPLHVINDKKEIVLTIPPIFDHEAINVAKESDKKNLNSRLGSLVKLQDIYANSKPELETQVRDHTFNVSSNKLVSKDHSKHLYSEFKKQLDEYMKSKNIKIVDVDNKTTSFKPGSSSTGFINSDDEFEDD